MSEVRHILEVAIEPKSPTDAESVRLAASDLAAKDSRFSVATDRDSGLTIIRAASDSDLNACVDILIREYALALNIGPPQVAYRETITRAAIIRRTHKKVLGGSGEFAEVAIAFEPLPPGSGFVFENAAPAGAIPRELVPAVEKGLRLQKELGLLAGFPVIDFKARLVDGKYHEVDSRPIAFDIAARAAFRALADKDVVIVLEPVMNVEVVTPEDYLGGVIGDLNYRKGTVMGTDSHGVGFQIVTAAVPLANMFGYDKTLNSMTQGRARYSMTFDHYERTSSWGDDGGDDTFPGAMALRA